MHKLRLIARLDIKNENVIKGIHLEGLRKIGNPIDLAKKYYEQGIDEIIFMDAVASLYGRNNLFNIIESACKEVFIPITIGGGIRNISDIEMALNSGADKIAINTHAIKNPELIMEASRIYGSQCIVGSIEAMKKSDNRWEAYTDNGREETGIDAIEWAKELENLGAGELIITSINQEGTNKGFDIELIKKVSENVTIPVIASGGAGKIGHINDVVNQTQVGAVAIASLLHYNIHNVGEIKTGLYQTGINIRV
jgi:cyclase